MTYKKFMSLFLIAGSISSTLCSCAATDSSAVVGYVDECPITMEEFTANATPAYFVNNVIIYDGARTKFMHRDPFKSQTYFYNNVFYTIGSLIIGSFLFGRHNMERSTRRVSPALLSLFAQKIPFVYQGRMLLPSCRASNSIR